MLNPHVFYILHLFFLVAALAVNIYLKKKGCAHSKKLLASSISLQLYPIFFLEFRMNEEKLQNMVLYCNNNWKLPLIRAKVGGQFITQLICIIVSFSFNTLKQEEEAI